MLRPNSSFAFILSLFIALGLAACGGGRNPDLENQQNQEQDQEQDPGDTNDNEQEEDPGNQEQSGTTIAGAKYKILAGKDSLSNKANTLKGTGKIIFEEALLKPEVPKNIKLEFSLEPGGSMTYSAFAQKDLTRGVNVVFTRPTAADKPLQIKFTSKTENYEINEFLKKQIPATGRIKVLVDMHNDHGDSMHFLVWDGSQPVGDKPKETALINDMFDDRGFGPHFGVELNKAHIFDMKIGKPLDEH